MNPLPAYDAESIRDELRLLAADAAPRMFSARAADPSGSGQRRWLAGSILTVIVGSLVAGLIWASRSRLEEVVRGEGKVIPDTSIQVIQSLEGGIVKELLVKEGDAVTQGQVLLRMHDVQIASRCRENVAARDTLLLRLARLQSEVGDSPVLQLPEKLLAEHPEDAAAEELLFSKRKQDLNAGLNSLTALLKNKRAKLAELMPLFQSRDLPLIQRLDLEAEIEEISGKMTSAKTGFVRASIEQLDEDSSKLKTLEEKIRSDEDQLSRSEIKSPLDGVVNKIFITSAARVIQGGQQIMEVVPAAARMEVEARIKPGDIGFLREQLPVRVRFTAYDFTAYGSLSGTVKTLGADTVAGEQNEEYYPVKIQLAGQDMGRDALTGQELRLRPGMIAEVDVLTGERSVLDYLLKPIHRARRMALRER